jgi:hypothetical protein
VSSAANANMDGMKVFVDVYGDGDGHIRIMKVNWLFIIAIIVTALLCDQKCYFAKR